MIYMSQDYNGNLDINGGQVISTGGSAVRIEGNGATTVDNTKVSANTLSKMAIYNNMGESTGTLTVGSSSVISNTVNKQNQAAITLSSIDDVTITGNTEVDRWRKACWWRHG